MSETLILVLILMLLQVKHLVVDFHLQTNEMVAGKGIYGNGVGMLHSAQHFIGTFLVLALTSLLFGAPLTFAHALVLGVIDGVTHYHIDWAKMNLGCRDIKEKKFWTDLGLDQMAHQIGYIVIAFAAIVIVS